MTSPPVVRQHPGVIRNVCIHVSNEQPLVCDLFAMPTASDAGLVCTNVRSLDGKRPVFIDQVGSTFFFPYHIVRFLEIPEESMVAYRADGGRIGGVLEARTSDGERSALGRADRPFTGGDPSSRDGADEDDLEVASNDGAGSLLPVAVGGQAPGDDDLDLDIEIDEDFLQRVRDI